MLYLDKIININIFGIFLENILQFFLNLQYLIIFFLNIFGFLLKLNKFKIFGNLY